MDPQLRAPPRPHHRCSSETLFPRPGSFLPLPRVCFPARCRYFPSPEPPRVPSVLRLSVAGLAAPHRALTSPWRQAYQVWTELSPCSGSSEPRILSTPGEEEGQAPRRPNQAVTRPIGSSHRGLRAGPWGPPGAGKGRFREVLTRNRADAELCPTGEKGGG